jgi:hypothetical protein
MIGPVSVKLIDPARLEMELTTNLTATRRGDPERRR